MKTIYFKIGLFLSLLFIAYSCLNNENSNGEVEIAQIELDIDTMILNRAILFSELFTEAKIIPLETKEECLIHSITDIKLIGDTLYVFDRKTKSVFLFSIQGKYISKICKVGNGPGEYISPMDFDINTYKKSICILDYTKHCLNDYDIQGNFLEKTTLNTRFSSFTLFGDNIYLFKPFQKNGDDYRLHIATKKDGKTIKRVPIRSNLSKPIYPIELLPSGNFYKSNNDIKFIMAYNNTIYTIKNNITRPFIKLITNKYKLTDNDIITIEKEKSLLSKGLRTQKRLEKFTKISSYSDNGQLAYFKFYIGEAEYQTFYFFKTKRTICFGQYIDDISFLYPQLLKIYDNQLVAFIDQAQLSALKRIVSSGKILNEDEKKRFLTISEYDNPIIVLFNVKNN